MLTLQVKEKEIENLTPEEEFIRGTVGAECQIVLDEFWQGYENTVVFKRENDCTVYNVAIDSLSNRVEIPYTILAESGSFKVGLFGVKPDEVLPTLWSDYIKVRYGTDTHGTTPPKYEPNEIDQLRLSKQDKLVSGENIKTVNGESVLGSGNIKIQVEVDQTYDPDSTNAQSGTAVAEALSGYVMAEVGKGLSSNDFTNEDKEKLYSALQNEDIAKNYNPTSENAQSGIAVAEAVASKADKTEVNKLKGDIDNIKKIVLVENELSLKKTDFTVGSLQAASFAVDVTKTHALTYMKHIDANENDVIKITVPVIDGVYYKYRFGFYNASKEYISQEAFTTINPYIIPQKNTKYIAFCIIAYNQVDDTTHSNLIDEFSETDIIKFENLSKPAATMEDVVSDIAELQNKKRVYRHMVNAAMKPKNITSNGYLSQLQPLALFHFSDIHGDAIETERISSVYQDIVNKCDDVICTGDIVELRYSNDATFMTDGSSSKNYLLAIGNHDVLTDESGFDFTQRATQEQQYAKFFDKNIANWGVTYTSNKTYYYKDYSAKKIRFIVLNNMLTSTDATEQLTWLETTLADAITNDYSVVIGMHYPVYGFTKIDCAFTRRDREIPSVDCCDISICQKVQTFIDNGGDFICYIGGHKHGDYIGYSSSYPAQISILVDSANRQQSNQYSDLMRVDGEISQDLYNVIVFDKSISAIKIIRIGCDVDNYMRHRDMLCINYQTKNILSSSLPIYNGGVV